MRTTLVLLQQNINQIGDEYVRREGPITTSDGKVLDRWKRVRHELNLRLPQARKTTREVDRS